MAVRNESAVITYFLINPILGGLFGSYLLVEVCGKTDTHTPGLISTRDRLET